MFYTCTVHAYKINKKKIIYLVCSNYISKNYTNISYQSKKGIDGIFEEIRFYLNFVHRKET